jgi:nicotinamidase-related amidase
MNPGRPDPTRTTALLLVDVQQGFDDASWGTRNNLDAESNIAALLAAWRKHERPVVPVRHRSLEAESPLRFGQPGYDYKEQGRPLPGEAEFCKTVNSAFIGTELEQHLGEQGVRALVIVGFTTDHCISTTTRMAARSRGYAY